MGNGNIGGVATAILLGGPGAIFWMWVTAAVGMATKYAEAVAGVHYRVTREDTGELASGPMYYITRAVPHRRLGAGLAYMFAFFGACTALLGTGNMAQSNTVARTFAEAARTMTGVEVPLWIPGLLIMVAVGLVLLGGIRRIAAVAARLVPTMIVVYVLAASIYLLLNLTAIPGVLVQIVTNAFTPSAAVGGFAGAAIAQVIAAGVSRGVLSNEAGLGSAPIAHGIAKVNHPSEQGLVGVFEVFVDTIVVCSMTAFVILTSGLWTDPAYQGASGDLTAAALGTSVPLAAFVVALCSFLFGFSTLLGWSYYGEACVEFLWGARAIMPYRVVFTGMIPRRRGGVGPPGLGHRHAAERLYGLPEPHRPRLPRRHGPDPHAGLLRRVVAERLHVGAHPRLRVVAGKEVPRSPPPPRRPHPRRPAPVRA